MQVHGIGGAAGVIWYALMAHKEFVTELYGASPSPSWLISLRRSWHGWVCQQSMGVHPCPLPYLNAACHLKFIYSGRVWLGS